MSSRILTDARRTSLLRSIKDRRCVLFLGPGTAFGPSGKSVEEELLDRVSAAAALPADQPRPDKLRHLCQLAGAERLRDIRELVSGYFDELELSGFTTDAHRSFARMDFPLIIQLTADPLMVNALKVESKTRDTGCYDYALPLPPPHNKDEGEDDDCCLVYGLRGLWTSPRSVPLSTDEDISHLVALVRENPKVPEALSAKLRGSGTDQRSALFVGFDFAAWQTRMLLRGLFAVSPTTISMPEPAVANLPGCTPGNSAREPSPEDREFLWSCFRLIFTEEPPDQFASKLESDLKALDGGRGSTARRVINQGALRKFLAELLPEEDLTNLGFDIPEFIKHNGQQSWETGTKPAKVRLLIGWIREQGRLEDLMQRIAAQAPQLFEEHEPTLYQS